MFNFITEAIKQRQEARQLALNKPKKEKKEKPKKEKGKYILLFRLINASLYHMELTNSKN